MTSFGSIAQRRVMEQRATLTPVRVDVSSCDFDRAHPSIARLLQVSFCIMNEEDEAREEIQGEFMKQKEDEDYRLHQSYQKWKLEYAEAQQRALEFRAYWERRHKDDRDLWRDKDFANAVDKMSRAGYKGEFGHHEVPEEDKIKLDALYMQVTSGDFDGNTALKCAEEWKLLAGKTKIEAQDEFIHMTNKMLTRYGWNPPEGWI